MGLALLRPLALCRHFMFTFLTDGLHPSCLATVLASSCVDVGVLRWVAKAPASHRHLHPFLRVLREVRPNLYNIVYMLRRELHTAIHTHVEV